jgi:hypothetical protein
MCTSDALSDDFVIVPEEFVHEPETMKPPVPKAWMSTFLHSQQSSARVIIYRFNDGSGWGNRLRAMHFVMMYALLTERAVLIQCQDWSLHFDSPIVSHEGTEVAINLKQGPYDSLINLSADTLSFDEACVLLESDSGIIRDDHLPRVISYETGNSPDICLFRNPKYHSFLNKTFGTTSRYAIMGEIASFLCSRPSHDYLRAVRYTQQLLRWHEFDVHIAVQFRSFVDDKETHAKMDAIFPRFCQETFRVVSDYLDKHPGKAMLYFTSDDDHLFQRFFKSISKLSGRVTFERSPFPYVHSSSSHGYGIKAPLVEWYLLGESELLISTGTTFAQFAKARTNWYGDFWHWYKDKLHLLPHHHDGIDQDIDF